MDNDPELKAWAADWQTGSQDNASGEAIRQYAHGRSRFMWKWALAEATVGVVGLPLLFYMAWTTTNTIERWAMATLAVITVAAMCVGWWNWRGSLLASAGTTAEYVAVSTERLRRMRQAWRIGWAVLVAEVAVFIVWVWNQLYGGTRAPSQFAERFAWSWLAVMSLSAVVFLLWMDRSIRRDEAKFLSLKHELDIPDEAPTSRGPHPPASGPGPESRLRARLRSRNRAFPR